MKEELKPTVPDARMDDDVREMALQCYGYGRWNAPYWFIGPEQGQAPDEDNELKPRVKAWHDLGGGELNDCRQFHALLAKRDGIASGRSFSRLGDLCCCF
jgi:hypothetical protein